MILNRRQIVPLLLTGMSLISGAWWFLKRRAPDHGIKGIVWQVDNATVDINGDWGSLGIRELLIQWTVVDELAFIPGTGLPLASRLPDWDRIARQPWAREVILGLAGRFQETEARQNVDRLVELSKQISSLPTPLNVSGWYFPVEVDPTWSDAPRMGALLAELPRPLWISVYDSANVGARTLADWLESWLPKDVGVFFQDGVGVYARDAMTARLYADTLAAMLGQERLRVIVEAFRPNGANGFRSATIEELSPQIEALSEHHLYLYDGPHYVNEDLVRSLERAVFCLNRDSLFG